MSGGHACMPALQSGARQYVALFLRASLPNCLPTQRSHRPRPARRVMTPAATCCMDLESPRCGPPPGLGSSPVYRYHAMLSHPLQQARCHSGVQLTLREPVAQQHTAVRAWAARGAIAPTCGRSSRSTCTGCLHVCLAWHPCRSQEFPKRRTQQSGASPAYDLYGLMHAATLSAAWASVTQQCCSWPPASMPSLPPLCPRSY